MSQDSAHPLSIAFAAALNQASSGKGTRHGGASVDFYMQRWRYLADVHGEGFLTGQAQKKLEEAASRWQLGLLDKDAYLRELLGAMVYIGMAVLYSADLPENYADAFDDAGEFVGGNG